MVRQRESKPRYSAEIMRLLDQVEWRGVDRGGYVLRLDGHVANGVCFLCEGTGKLK